MTTTNTNAGGKPSKGTPADKRLKENKTTGGAKVTVEGQPASGGGPTVSR